MVGHMLSMCEALVSTSGLRGGDREPLCSLPLKDWFLHSSRDAGVSRKAHQREQNLATWRQDRGGSVGCVCVGGGMHHRPPPRVNKVVRAEGELQSGSRVNADGATGTS